MFYVPLYTSICLILLGVCLLVSYKRKSKLSLELRRYKRLKKAKKYLSNKAF